MDCRQHGHWAEKGFGQVSPEKSASRQDLGETVDTWQATGISRTASNSAELLFL